MASVTSVGFFAILLSFSLAGGPQFVGASDPLDTTPCDILRNTTYYPPLSANVSHYIVAALLLTETGSAQFYAAETCRFTLLWAEKMQAANGMTSASGNVGVKFYLYDVSVSASLILKALTEAQLVKPHVLFTPFSSGLTEATMLYLTLNATYSGFLDDLLAIAPAAASGETYYCPTSCSNATDCVDKRPPCTTPGVPRFKNLVGVFMPSSAWLKDYIDLVKGAGAERLVMVYNPDDLFTSTLHLGTLEQVVRRSMTVELEIAVRTNDTYTEVVVDDNFPCADGDTTRACVSVNAPTFEAAYDRVVALARNAVGSGGETLPMVQASQYLDCEALVLALRRAAWQPASFGSSMCMEDTRFQPSVGSDERYVVGSSLWERNLRGSSFIESPDRSLISHFQPRPELGEVSSAQRYANEYESKFNLPIYANTAIAASSWYFVEGAVKLTLNTAGPDDPAGAWQAEFRSKVRNVYSPSFAGMLSVNAFGINDNLETAMIQADASATHKIIYPAHSAQMPFVFPTPSVGSEPRNPPCPPGSYISQDFHWCTAADSPEDRAAALDGLWCGGVCTPCAAGSFANVTGSSACTTCPNNTAAPASGATNCSVACKLGYVHNANRTGCAPCPAGTTRTEGQTVCTPCQPGTFSSILSNSGRCLSCDLFKPSPNSSLFNSDASDFSYAPSSGSASCELCPRNTLRLIGTPALSVDECVCAPGFYQIQNISHGAACTPCPQGAVCVGHTSITSTAALSDGANQSVTGTSSSLSTALSFQQRASFRNAWPVPAKDMFALWEDVSLAASLGREPKFHQCASPGLCTGGADYANQCREGFTGVKCSRCEDGYFAVTSSCFKCPMNKGLAVMVFVGAFCVVLFMWWSLNTVAAGGYETFNITLLFAQVLSTVQSYSLAWPGSLTMFHSILSFVNFDIDLVSPNCFMQWTSRESFFLTLALPPIIATHATLSSMRRVRAKLSANMPRECVTFFYVARIMMWAAREPGAFLASSLDEEWIEEEEMKSDLDGESSVKKRSCRVKHLEASHSRQRWMGSANANLPGMKARIMVSDEVAVVINDVISFLVVIYNGLCIKSLTVFPCTSRGPGAPDMLITSPNLICGSRSHSIMLAAGILGVVFYVVGVPAYLCVTLFRSARKNRLFHPHFLGRYGALYRKYHPESFYWELTFLLRRAAVSILLVVAWNFPHHQAFVTIIVLACNLMWSSALSPFKLDSIDMVDQLFQLNIIVYIGAGIIMNDENFRHSLYMSYLIMFVTIGMISRGMYQTYLEIMATNVTNAANRLLAARLLNVWETSRELKQPGSVKKRDESSTRSGRKKSRAVSVATNAAMDDFFADAAEAAEDVDNKQLRFREKVKNVLDIIQSDISEGRTHSSHKSIADRLPTPLHPMHFISSSMLYDGTEAVLLEPPDVDLAAAKARLLMYSDTSIIELMSHTAQGAGELANSVDGAALRKWLYGDEGKNPKVLSAWLDVTSNLHGILGDSSSLGTYSVDAEAKFGRDFISRIPVVVDYLFECSEEQQAAFATTLVGLGRAYKKYGVSGRVARFIEDEDHAPLSLWLAFATEEDRQDMQQLIASIVQHLSAE